MFHVWGEITGLGRASTLTAGTLTTTGVCLFLGCRRQNEVYVTGITGEEVPCLQGATSESRDMA